MSQQVFNQLQNRIQWVWKKIQKLDWTNPLPWMVTATLVIIPLVAKVYVMSGMLLGLLMCISVTLLINKSPEVVRKFIVNYPLLSDLALTAGVTLSVGSIFGSGLILGIGAVFTGVLLSVTLPLTSTNGRKEQSESVSPSPA